MKLQLLSDLHLETEAFEPEPHPQAELLVLAGDIDSTWRGYERFAGWPVPVVVVAGNHEFDGREMNQAWPALREFCGKLGFTLLERQSLVLTAAQGRRIRFVGTVRWCDFDLWGQAKRAKALRSGAYFQNVMAATQGGAPFDALAVRQQALACGAWLAATLAEPHDADATVAVTHFAPSAQSADPRYRHNISTAAFCNADDALVPHADVWLHGHLHCRHDYRLGPSRVVCNARGLESKGESLGYDALKLIDV
jgi:DNA repair exonuclease SbcCD nuclease subunit